MNKIEKIQKIERILKMEDPNEKLYVNLLCTMGDLKNNYMDYMITEPLDYKEELKRVPEADYVLCTALLSMLLRETNITDNTGEKLVLERMQNTLKIGE